MQVEFQELGLNYPALQRCLVCYAIVHYADEDNHAEWHKEPNRVNVLANLGRCWAAVPG